MVTSAYYHRFFIRSAKRLLSLLAIFSLCTSALAAPGPDLWQWKPVKGVFDFGIAPIFDEKGVANERNRPGGREDMATWSGLDGKLWLFGGNLLDNQLNPNEYMSDLWCFDPDTGLWTWVNGDESPNQAGVYGTKGMAAFSNRPGSRTSAMTWTTPDGRLWLFGGSGYDSTGTLGLLDDVWVFDPDAEAWAWVAGSNTEGEFAVIGFDPAPANTPGGRYLAAGVVDSNGNFWLVSGYGRTSIGGTGLISDVWKFHTDSLQWEKIAGLDAFDQPGVYGSQGTESVSNFPGGRRKAAIWIDGDGFVWLFGGWGMNKDGNPRYMNDVWRFNPTSEKWAWMKGSQSGSAPGGYGTLGEENPAAAPGGRRPAAWWMDSDGSLLVFGGEGYDASDYGYYNDLWRYNPSTNNWAWIGGPNTRNTLGSFGTKGVAGASNIPSPRVWSGVWQTEDGGWLYSGEVLNTDFSIEPLTDLWKIDPDSLEWTWVSGSPEIDTRAKHGTEGVPEDANHPGRRRDAASAFSGGYLWLFSGVTALENTTFARLNDLWKFDPSTNQWTWVRGSNMQSSGGVYGTKGVSDPANDPGAREKATMVPDGEGGLFLFGGQGYDGIGEFGFLNDLWHYDADSNEWTWIHGSNAANQAGMYGLQNISSPTNVPGGRQSPTIWPRDNGDFWMFGGQGYDSVGSEIGLLGDFWKYDESLNRWTWVRGSKLIDPPGSWGSKGVSSNSNEPGGRIDSASWTDSNGYIWMLGGEGRDFNGEYGALPDLWRYQNNTAQWTWMRGANTKDEIAIHGLLGLPGPANRSGSRIQSPSWSHPRGGILFGGRTMYIGLDYRNDLMIHDPAINQWTWIGGSKLLSDTTGRVVSSGFHPENRPGSRRYGSRWDGEIGDIWLYGGRGADVANWEEDLIGLWRALPFPPEPTDAMVVSTTMNEISWSWTDNSTQETGFKIYVGEGTNAPNSPTDTVGADVTSYMQSGFGPNTMVAFRVSAQGEYARSARTPNLVAYTLAEIPDAPLVENPDAHTMEVIPAETDGNSDHTEYSIRVIPLIDGKRWVQPDGTIGPGGTRAWLTRADWQNRHVRGLAENTEYRFRVRARNGDGVETADGPAGVNTTLAEPRTGADKRWGNYQ